MRNDNFILPFAKTPSRHLPLKALSLSNFLRFVQNFSTSIQLNLSLLPPKSFESAKVFARSFS
ncbi:MAG: hypothetical protein ACTS4U_01190 [Candidatus Hodgkinia cicadicola]